MLSAAFRAVMSKNRFQDYCHARQHVNSKGPESETAGVRIQNTEAETDSRLYS
jgi:hypothetical protein